MSHLAQMQYLEGVRARWPQYFAGRRVLEVGSRDVNGTVRGLFTNSSSYFGVDVTPGPCVDVVAPEGAAAWLASFQDVFRFDTVISAECFEHDQHLPDTLRQIERHLAPGGLFVFTCATTGRGEHGTRRTTPDDAPGLPWPDFYQNRTVADFISNLTLSLYSEFGFSFGFPTCDLYGYFIKRFG